MTNDQINIDFIHQFMLEERAKQMEYKKQFNNSQGEVNYKINEENTYLSRMKEHFNPKSGTCKNTNSPKTVSGHVLYSCENHLCSECKQNVSDDKHIDTREQDITDVCNNDDFNSNDASATFKPTNIIIEGKGETLKRCSALSTNSSNKENKLNDTSPIIGNQSRRDGKPMLRIGEFSPLNPNFCRIGRPLLGFGEYEERRKIFLEKKRKEYQKYLDNARKNSDCSTYLTEKNSRNISNREKRINTVHARSASSSSAEDNTEDEAKPLTPRGKFVPGIGLLESGDTEYEKWQKQNYRKELDKQIEERNRLQNIKEQQERHESAKIENEQHLMEQRMTDCYEKDQVERSLSVLRELHQLDNFDNQERSNSFKDNIKYPENQKYEKFPSFIETETREEYRKCKTSPLPSSRSDLTSILHLNRGKSANCRSIRAHGVETHGVDNKELEACNKLNQELYKLELDKQLEYKTRMKEEELKKERLKELAHKEQTKSEENILRAETEKEWRQRLAHPQVPPSKQDDMLRIDENTVSKNEANKPRTEHAVTIQKTGKNNNSSSDNYNISRRNIPDNGKPISPSQRTYSCSNIMNTISPVQHMKSINEDIETYNKIRQELYRLELIKQIEEKKKLIEEKQAKERLEEEKLCEKARKEQERLKQEYEQEEAEREKLRQKKAMEEEQQRLNLCKLRIENEDNKREFVEKNRGRKPVMKDITIHRTDHIYKSKQQSPKNVKFSKETCIHTFQPCACVTSKQLSDETNNRYTLDDSVIINAPHVMALYSSQCSSPYGDRSPILSAPCSNTQFSSSDMKLSHNTIKHSTDNKLPGNTVECISNTKITDTKCITDDETKCTRTCTSFEAVKSNDESTVPLSDGLIHTANPSVTNNTEENLRPPSPVLPALQTSALLRKFPQLDKVPTSVSMSDAARAEYRTHILANLSEIRRQLMQMQLQYRRDN